MQRRQQPPALWIFDHPIEKSPVRKHEQKQDRIQTHTEVQKKKINRNNGKREKTLKTRTNSSLEAKQKVNKRDKQKKRSAES